MTAEEKIHRAMRSDASADFICVVLDDMYAPTFRTRLSGYGHDLIVYAALALLLLLTLGGS